MKIRTQRSALSRAWDKFGEACDTLGVVSLKVVRHEFFPLLLIGILFLIISQMEFVERVAVK